MDTRKLKYFLAVVDHDGFNRAAEHLLIAQPSLSQTIAALEKDLGVPLFHRIGRRAVLSEAGKELVGPARLVMRDLDAAQSAVKALRGVRSGRLDIITMPSPGIEPLTSMIAGFTRAHPRSGSTSAPHSRRRKSSNPCAAAARRSASPDPPPRSGFRESRSWSWSANR